MPVKVFETRGAADVWRLYQLEWGFATMPLPGIDVPFHSQCLWAGVCHSVHVCVMFACLMLRSWISIDLSKRFTLPNSILICLLASTSLTWWPPTYKAISVWIVMEVAVQNVAEPALAAKNQVRDVRRTFTQIMSLKIFLYSQNWLLLANLSWKVSGWIRKCNLKFRQGNGKDFRENTAPQCCMIIKIGIFSFHFISSFQIDLLFKVLSKSACKPQSVPVSNWWLWSFGHHDSPD